MVHAASRLIHSVNYLTCGRCLVADVKHWCDGNTDHCLPPHQTTGPEWKHCHLRRVPA